MFNIKQCLIKINAPDSDRNYILGLELAEVPSRNKINRIPQNVTVWFKKNNVYLIEISFQIGTEGLISPTKIRIEYIELSEFKVNLSYIENFKSSAIAQEFFRIATKVIPPIIKHHQAGENLKCSQNIIFLKPDGWSNFAPINHKVFLDKSVDISQALDLFGISIVDDDSSLSGDSAHQNATISEFAPEIHT